MRHARRSKRTGQFAKGSGGSHRKTHRRRRNPSGPVATALTWLGGGAIVGAGIGALTNTNRPVGAFAGAVSGVSLVGVAGLVVGLVKPNAQADGFATAGIGLGGLALLGLVMGIVGPGALTGTTTTTTTGTAGPPQLPSQPLGPLKLHPMQSLSVVST